MIRVVDASVVLAVCHQEQGSDIARESMRRGLISTVNLSEVYEKAIEYGRLPIAEAIVQTAALEVVEFDELHALEAAKFAEQARKKGISFADRACLALGVCEQLPVVTADRSWTELDLGIKIELFRDGTD
ncbi:MAG: type II toxin-antitoxin system VapC family toxin [Planctomycetales bacterium]|nr:type II toxin-antitoxin system VapC family toxin [Planctomycetales bacterium]